MIPWIDNEQHAATVFGPRQWVFPNALLIKMGSIILLTVYLEVVVCTFSRGL